MAAQSQAEGLLRDGGRPGFGHYRHSLRSILGNFLTRAHGSGEIPRNLDRASPSWLKKVKSLASSFFVILLSGFSVAAATPNTQSEFWPEVDTYISLNSATRLFLLSSFRNNQEGDAWHGDFGAHINFALKPVFRRELRQRDDVFNKRFLSCQAGFRYISSLANGAPYLEHRWIVDCTPQYPLPGKIIVSDRSRGEMRFISGKPFSTRYRNKLQLERDFAIGRFVYTPYINGEVFYDTRYDAWDQNRYSAGVQVPAGAHVVLETYFLRQNHSRSASPHVNAFGLRFRFYF